MKAFLVSTSIVGIVDKTKRIALILGTRFRKSASIIPDILTASLVSWTLLPRKRHATFHEEEK
jgi:putative Ca2+/H+ antiporter (TMEM165/GDT1 family)